VASLVASSGRFSTGTVNVGAGAQFNLTGGSTDLATLDLSGGGTFGFTGGSLHAQTVLGSFTNQGGTLAPGTSAGSTAITGNYLQESAGRLEIEIGGAVPGSSYDTVGVTGDAVLDGVLDASLLGGFAPTPGQMFNVLTAGSVTNGGIQLGGPAGSSFYMLIGSASVILQAAGLPGDFNFDGVVDAADYVTLRQGQGYLPSHFDLWRANFGQPGSGTGAGGSANAAVPEPAAFVLAWGALLVAVARRRRSSIQ
jgi:hypothetical protein